MNELKATFFLIAYFFGIGLLFISTITAFGLRSGEAYWLISTIIIVVSMSYGRPVSGKVASWFFRVIRWQIIKLLGNKKPEPQRGQE